MTSRALVSVVVPVHNVVGYLPECLASIASQSESAIEVVLVDDGSTDGSERICDDWAARDGRFRVIHQSQKGSSVARNAGIDLASGSYLTFVDADDVMGPRLVELLLRAAQETCADIVLGEFATFTQITAVAFTEGTLTTLSPADDELLQIMCVRPQWGPMAKLFRRELFEDGLRFPEGLLHQDLAIMPRIFDRAQDCARTDAVVYAYRDRPGSITDTVQRVALSTDLLTILRDNIEFARVTQKPAAFEIYLATYLLHARKRVERLTGRDSWSKNLQFIAGYRSLVVDYLVELKSMESMSVAERMAFLASVRLPRPYVLARASVAAALRPVRNRTRTSPS